jgi:hypothetical protein
MALLKGLCPAVPSNATCPGAVENATYVPSTAGTSARPRPIWRSSVSRPRDVRWYTIASGLSRLASSRTAICPGAAASRVIAPLIETRSRSTVADYGSNSTGIK